MSESGIKNIQDVTDLKASDRATVSMCSFCMELVLFQDLHFLKFSFFNFLFLSVIFVFIFFSLVFVFVSFGFTFLFFYFSFSCFLSSFLI